MSFKKKEKNGEYKNDIKEIKAKNGTCLFFSGSLLHSVTPNLSNNIRKTLAMNFEISHERDKNV
jgi:ectoine hydroxylase-related dioxygenase (phytanoyl-CoA dioxygenase family)